MLKLACVAGVKRGGGRGGGREFGQKTEDQGGGEGEKKRLLQRPLLVHFCGCWRPQNSDWLIRQ